MRDLNEKVRERWQDRRKKSFNWIKILIMLGALIAILYVMSQLNTVDNINWQNTEAASPQSEQQQSPSTDTPTESPVPAEETNQ